MARGTEDAHPRPVILNDECCPRLGVPQSISQQACNFQRSTRELEQQGSCQPAGLSAPQSASARGAGQLAVPQCAHAKTSSSTPRARTRERERRTNERPYRAAQGVCAVWPARKLRPIGKQKRPEWEHGARGLAGTRTYDETCPLRLRADFSERGVSSAEDCGTSLICPGRVRSHLREAKGTCSGAPRKGTTAGRVFR